MIHRHDDVCPVELAARLDNRYRRWFQNPSKLLAPYIEEGMTVLDFGCGPGYFTVDMAKMVGDNGRIIAVDRQEGMLQLLKNKITGTELESRITLHKSEADKIGLTDRIDFALAFYVIHELPSQEDFFKELASILKPGGKVFLSEPPFRAPKNVFMRIIKIAEGAGFRIDKKPRIFITKTVVLRKN
jgi:ubiquinone/menaquinone biosynthesis C-methylase UbiE